MVNAPPLRDPLHAAFAASLVVKAVFAALEVLGGVAVYVVPQDAVLRFIEMLAHRELLAGRGDVVFERLYTWTQGFSMSQRHFAGVYLVTHGAVKLWLLAGLIRGKASYYPLAIAVFSAFVAYQLYRFHLTRSPVLIVLTVVDLVVIALTWREYRRRRAPEPLRA